MRKIILGGCGGGHVALVDDEDYERIVSAGPWWAASRGRVLYACRSPKKSRREGVSSLMHRWVCPHIASIDHIDRNGLNNQKANLRAATAAQNNRNAPKPRVAGATSIYKGVYFDAGRRRPWRVRIVCNKSELLYGSAHDTEVEAALAYNAAARRLLGEFAYINDVVNPVLMLQAA